MFFHVCNDGLVIQASFFLSVSAPGIIFDEMDSGSGSVISGDDLMRQISELKRSAYLLLTKQYIAHYLSIYCLLTRISITGLA